jgi:hypothetical protein
MEENFISEAEKHYFVFTDNPQIDFENENPRIHRIYQKDLGWPDNTLMRFHTFLQIEKELLNMDYLFFFNANLLIKEKITSEEFLPTGNENLVATLHPGFYNKNRKKFTYENNRKSTAYIDKNEGQYYFAGGLNGGKTADFIEAMKIMRDNVDTDNKNGIVAKWHDESHWNKYLINRSNIKILPPSYLYPEGWKLPFPPIILIRDKNKYGGHALLRNEKVNKLKIYYIKIKRLIIKFYNKYLESKMVFFKFMNPIYSNLKKFNLEKSKFILITIAFNNFEIIELQHKKITENLKEDFVHIIVDNSNIENISDEILEYCKINNIPYVKLPSNTFTRSPSKSHGKALNWSYRNIIEKYKPTYFGFIDHDIVPLKETFITKYIKDTAWGLIQEREKEWYLWAGFCFYKLGELKKYKLNFMPYHGLDTGGYNYHLLYKNINKDNILQIKQIYFDIDKNEKIDQFDNSKNIVEILGDWVHIMRISNWNNQDTTKNNKLNEIINAVEKYNFK